MSAARSARPRQTSAAIKAGILKNARLFSALDDRQRKIVMGVARVHSIEGDGVLFSTGDAAQSVYVILEGEIAIEILAQDGRAIRITTKGPGDVFGEIAALDGGDRSATARALTTARVLGVPVDVFLSLSASSTSFAEAIIRDLAGNIRRTDELLTGYIVDGLDQRVARAVLNFAIESGGAEATIRLTQAELANRLLSTRERVNRALQKLARDRVIELGRGRIVVLNLAALRDHAGAA